MEQWLDTTFWGFIIKGVFLGLLLYYIIEGIKRIPIIKEKLKQRADRLHNKRVEKYTPFIKTVYSKYKDLGVILYIVESEFLILITSIIGFQLLSFSAILFFIVKDTDPQYIFGALFIFIISFTMIIKALKLIRKKGAEIISYLDLKDLELKKAYESKQKELDIN